MARGEQLSCGLRRLGALVLVTATLPGCAGGDARSQEAVAPSSAGTGSTPAPPPGPAPAPRGGGIPPVDPSQTPRDAVPDELREQLIPEGVPFVSTGEPADPEQLKVVERWLSALTNADIPAAADTFADGAKVQNLTQPLILADRVDRIAFNRAFPCGAEVSAASSVEGYLIVIYRLTDRKGSGCDGPGGSAASTIKVEKDRMTEWFRLPNPLDERPEGPGQLS